MNSVAVALGPTSDRGTGTHPAIRVALVCMPFYGASRPAIQLGLLQGLARADGHECDTFHLNVELARALGAHRYEALCNHRGHMTGEWLFSVAAFGEGGARDDEPFLDAFTDPSSPIAAGVEDERRWLMELRHDVLPRFVEDCADAIDWGDYRVVGFTSTFQQNVASLALARRIRERHPDVTLLFGGANFEDEMGPAYLEAFDWIDYAIVGEADSAFGDFLGAIASGRDPLTNPGVTGRARGRVVVNRASPPARTMDDLPVPQYDEYFERVSTLEVEGGDPYPLAIPFESSRGCWWGQKHHCTFCGLNGGTMSYRSKSPDRVLEELGSHVLRYLRTEFEAVDNILDMSYLRTFFPELVQQGVDYEFFYEVKAHLTRSQLSLLHQGGVRVLQPGIENLSTHVLRLMNKGTTMLKNVRLMKWAAYYGIRVTWNLLWGFPGETDADYVEQLDLMRLLTHLEPPQGAGRIWLERFSPYFSERDRYPISGIRPESSYAHVYPTHLDLHRAAYFFEYDMDDVASPEVIERVAAHIDLWRRTWDSLERDSLVYRRVENGILIDDHRTMRGSATVGTYAFDGALARLYEFCSDTMHTPEEACVHLDGSDVAAGPGIRGITWALDEFCQRGLMVRERDHYLALALPAHPAWRDA